MIHYQVRVPSAPYENTDCFSDLDRATDWCYSLSEEYGSAEVGFYDIHGHYHLVLEY